MLPRVYSAHFTDLGTDQSKGLIARPTKEVPSRPSKHSQTTGKARESWRSLPA